MREFPGGPAVRTWCFHCGSLGSVPGWGTKILQAMRKKKEKKIGLSVFLPGKFHGQRSLAGYNLWGCKEPDTSESMHMCYQHLKCTLLLIS